MFYPNLSPKVLRRQSAFTYVSFLQITSTSRQLPLERVFVHCPTWEKNHVLVLTSRQTSQKRSLPLLLRALRLAPAGQRKSRSSFWQLCRAALIDCVWHYPRY